ncbi:MAG: hypothetical protein KF760_23700 [Candidatus Eremiobacteraeota bacterium]|nr:hypothetical protein [Candidatus Eremiobacteraeota bacterium]MCW5866230.1 hypothetical protein [Candidatus Eremiobacteraeota bacterium]
MLALLLSAALAYTSADGMCQADFPAPVPDRPGGFLLFHNGNLYSFALKIWNQSPERYYESSRLFRSLEKDVEERSLRIGPVTGWEFHTVSREGRHNLVQQFAANGFVYEFSAYYSGERPEEVARFFQSIRFSSAPKDAARTRLIQCSVLLDGLASELLDHRPFPTEKHCPAGGAYILEQNGLKFSIHCDGDHGLPPGYPRIDQTRQILEGPDKPLPRPDL